MGEVCMGLDAAGIKAEDTTLWDESRATKSFHSQILGGIIPTKVALATQGQ